MPCPKGRKNKPKTIRMYSSTVCSVSVRFLPCVIFLMFTKAPPVLAYGNKTDVFRRTAFIRRFTPKSRSGQSRPERLFLKEVKVNE